MALGGAIAGVLSGTAGALINNGFNLFAKKQDQKHELDLLEARRKEMELEHSLAIQKITLEADIAADIASHKSFDIAQQMGNQRMTGSESINKLFDRGWTVPFGVILLLCMGSVDIIIGAIRPAITLILMYIVAYITFDYFRK